jgi:hypothetical protein
VCFARKRRWEEEGHTLYYSPVFYSISRIEIA